MSNDYVIKIVLQAVDQISRPLASLTRQLSGLKGVVAGLGAYFAFSALKRNVLEAESATHRLEQAVKNMGAGAGRTTKQIDELATKIQQTTKFSDDAAKEAAVKLLRYNKLTGESFDRALMAATNLAEGLQMDLGSAARMVGMALQDPQRGMLMLRRAGIILSAQQRELIKDLMKTGDVAGAQKVIFGELERVYGGFAESARNTLGGALEGLENQFTDLFEGDSSSFGNATKAINDLSKMLSDPAIKQGFDIFITGAVTAAAKMIEWTTAILGGINALAQLRAAQEQGYTMVTNTPLDAANEELKKLRREREAQVNAVSAISGIAPPPGQQIAPILGDGGNLKRVMELNKLIDEQIKLITKLQTVTKPEGSPAAKAATTDTTGGAAAKFEEILITAQKMGGSAAEQIRDIEREVLLSAMPEQQRLAAEWAQEEAAAVAAGVSAGLDKADIDAKVQEISDKYLKPIEITEVKLPIPKMEEQINEFAVQAARNIQDAFANAFMNIDQGWKGLLRGMLQAFGSLFANLAAKNLIKALGLEELVSGKKATGGLGKVLQTIFDWFTPKSKSGGGGAATTGSGASNPLEEIIITATRKTAGRDSAGGTTVSNVLDGIQLVKVINTDFEPVPVKIISNGSGTGSDPLASALSGAIMGSADAVNNAMGSAVDVMAGIGEKTAGAMEGFMASARDWANRTLRDLTIAMMPKEAGWGEILMNAGMAALKAAGSAAASSAGGLSDVNVTATRMNDPMPNTSMPDLYNTVGRAGGGRVASPVWVGEEGPELFMPAVPGSIMNGRQLAFASAGGPSVSYAPVYNISVQGAKDDSRMLAQLRAYIDRKDSETEGRVHESLRRNGYGRIKR